MLSAHGQAEIVGEAGDAAVFHAGFGLEFKSRDHRAGIDLRDRAEHVELGALLGQYFREPFQLVVIDRLRTIRTLQQ
jgi:hypothetical protein